MHPDRIKDTVQVTTDNSEFVAVNHGLLWVWWIKQKFYPKVV